MTDPLTPPRERSYNILDHLAAWQQDARDERQHGGYKTGWPTIDHALERPLRAGELVIIGARPGVGKSYAGVEILRNNLIAHPYTRAAMLSLEMPGSDVAERVAAIALRIAPRDLRRDISDPHAPDATLIPNDHPWLLRLLVNDDEHLAAEDLTPTLEKMGRPPIVFVDYLGLIGGIPTDTEYQQVSRAVVACKLAARKTNALVILAAQLRRNNDMKDDDTRPPSMSDLKSSGHIEATADRILGLWRDPDDRSIVNVRILKNRHGSGTGKQIALLQGDSGELREMA